MKMTLNNNKQVDVILFAFLFNLMYNIYMYSGNRAEVTLLGKSLLAPLRCGSVYA